MSIFVPFELDYVKVECHLSLRNLLDGLNRHLRALQVLKQPVDSWDALIIHMISLKLDNSTRREWESEYSKHDSVTLEMFTNFLLEKCRVLETLQTNNNQKGNRRHTFSTTHHTPTCSLCSKDHTVYNCKTFLNLNVNKRITEAKKRKWCLNCLRSNHSTEQCRSQPCRKCSKRHNTLLHINFTAETVNSQKNTSVNDNLKTSESTMQHAGQDNQNTLNAYSYHSLNNVPMVLLSTAMVNVLDKDNNIHTCRVMLDSGSESSFITERMCNKLGLNIISTNISVTGIGQTTSKVLKQTDITIQARQSSFEMNLKCLILPKITNKIPCMTIDISHLKIPTNIILADPSFNEPSPIDILVGCDKFWDLINTGQIKLGCNLPIIQKTQLGWIISGIIPENKSNSQITCSLSITQSLENSLTKFWELEERNIQKPLSMDNQACENLFKATTRQNMEGHFVVSLPLKHPTSVLGESREIAKKRFLNLEKKLQKNDELKTEYIRFLEEYEALGHMSQINADMLKNTDSFYLPHHCVINNSSTTTRLRVVFDGSSKSSSGYSLNDILLVGPTVQEDLFSIILRARQHNILLTGDVAKMYRQVFVDQSQRNLQLILWRSDPSCEIQTYQLNTLTYGTGSAAYLATRCLKELSIQCNQSNHLISQIIAKDFYVDDLCTGGSTVNEVKNIKLQISQLLLSGGFHLRKFHSNEPAVLTNDQGSENASVHFGEPGENKTLGLYWDSKNDIFKYSIQMTMKGSVTKRNILSCIAQIFDPLGLIAPVVITAKIVIQRLWQLKLSWDESVPLDVLTKWRAIYNQLVDLNDLKIPRTILIKNPISIELHGFSDASEVAFGACIFVRSIDSTGDCQVNLLCAKTRVAPLKVQTIPRLELCGALLLAELANKVKISLNIPFKKIYYWCDSTITLAWIKSQSQHFKIFVANRISQIQSLTKTDEWNYIKTNENPADHLSRGLSPGSLICNELWWHGPPWLSLSDKWWPITAVNVEKAHLPEVRTQTITLVTNINECDIFNKFSSLSKLQRVLAYCLRFVNNCKVTKCLRHNGFLSTNELNKSLLQLIKIAQYQEFTEEMRSLVGTNQVANKSSLIKLNPFIDGQGILRVGGRLQHSDFAENKKYPAILPAKHKLTWLIAQYEHIRLFHAGSQNLLSSLRDNYWPIAGRNLVKKVVRSCTKCFRFDASGIQYIMGNLPKHRLTPSRPFLFTGIDFMGPVLLKDRLTRNFKTVKAWVCLFICFSTRAVHLELVGDLSTNSFFAALRRFFSRRGISSDIYSDHGTNLIGAKNEIERLLLKNKDEIHSRLSCDGVKWHLIPPRAPHFGGLWEAGVKSTKFHLKRVIGTNSLTFEEYYTVLSQIEAILNSRPISPLSHDPSDPQPLTPAHFLIGQRLTTIPDEDYIHIPENRLSKFKRLQRMVQHFWARWSKEYISELQQRTKWKQRFPSLLKPGCVVLVKEDGLPPLKWQLAVVHEVHPGTDGVVRAATVKTATSIFKRPVAKLCILPNDD